MPESNLTLPTIVVEKPGNDSPSDVSTGELQLPSLLGNSSGNLTAQNISNDSIPKRSRLDVQYSRSSHSKTAVRSDSSVTVGNNTQKSNNEDKIRQITKSRRKGNGLNAEKVDDQMNYEHLKELEKIFEDAKSEGADGLSMEQFRVAMKETMGEHIDDRQLDLMFMKVDNNCDGTVDWDEYLSYMLLEYQEKENMFTMDQDVPFPNPLVGKPCNHIESICRITMLQAFSPHSNQEDESNDADDAASRYLTLSKEGVLNVWNLEWQVQKSVNLEGPKKSSLFTDMVCMANCNSFVVSSTEYEMSFYTITSNLIQKKFQIKDLHCCALTLDACFDRLDPRKGILLWGDTGGNVFILRFYENPIVALFASSKIPGGKISLDRLLRGNFPGIKIFRLPEVHGDWVQQIRYFSNKKGQECFLSCCVQEQSALFFADITDNTKSTKCVNRRSYFAIRKGVLCLSYDPEWNMIVTGSRDCDVRVWNPFIVRRSLAVLKGHHAAVLHVLIRNADHLVISISKDNNIRVWDLRYYTCKQNINGRNISLGRLDITSSFFHEKHKELVLGTNRIGIFFPKNSTSASSNRKQPRSHQKAVTCVLYNKLFHQIVTGGEDSMVCMWDMNTGKKTMQFCAEKGVEITSMTFDPTWRRLLTGMRNGATMLWNFNNGACLRRLANSDNLEISDIIFSKQRIVTAGWSKQPIVYMDSYTDDQYYPLNRKHGDDVMSLDYHRGDAILASSAYDGDIYLWSLESQEVIVAFNMHKSILPIHIGGRKAKPEETKNQHKNLAQHDSDESFSGNSASTSGRSECNIVESSMSTRKLRRRKNRRQSKTTNKSHQNMAGDNIETKTEYTASGTEISSTDIWLPKSLPWLEQNNHSSPKKVEDELDSDGEDEKEEKTLVIADRAVYKLLFLQSRHNNENTAVLISSNAMGWITAWSVHQRGGLLGFFKATKQANEMVISMDTDSQNEILITGDSKGYIRVWDISEYCDGADVIMNKKQQDEAKKLNRQPDNYSLFRHYTPITTAPYLQTSFRGHTMAVTSVAYIELHGLVATGSVDCSVRLWTIYGRYIGTFGQKNQWQLHSPLQEANFPSIIPEDVRRVGSNTTLKTIKGGYHTQWKQVKNVVNFFVKAGRVFNFLKPAEQEVKERKDSIKNMLTAVKKEILHESKDRTSRRNSVTVWLDDTPHPITVTKKPVDQVERCFRRLQDDGFKSSVLGKVNYKPKKRHRESKINKEIKWFNKHAAIYNILPYSNLTQPLEPTVPDYVRRTSPPAGDLYSSIMTRQRAASWGRRASKRHSNAHEAKHQNSKTRTISPLAVKSSSKVEAGGDGKTGGKEQSKENKKNPVQKIPIMAVRAIARPKKRPSMAKNASFVLPSIAT